MIRVADQVKKQEKRRRHRRQRSALMTEEDEDLICKQANNKDQAQVAPRDDWVNKAKQLDCTTEDEWLELGARR